MPSALELTVAPTVVLPVPSKLILPEPLCTRAPVTTRTPTPLALLTAPMLRPCPCRVIDPASVVTWPPLIKTPSTVPLEPVLDPVSTTLAAPRPTTLPADPTTTLPSLDWSETCVLLVTWALTMTLPPPAEGAEAVRLTAPPAVIGAPTVIALP